jgi:hypothetical protein
VQDLRKQAGLDVADRINLFVRASPALKKAIKANQDYIVAETLTVQLSFSEPAAGSVSVADEFDGEKVTVGLVKV